MNYKHFIMRAKYGLAALWMLLMQGIALVYGAEVCIIVTALPSNTPDGATIYMAGSLNGWDAGHADYALKNNAAGQPQITIEGTGTIQFKFTRGSWATVEGNQNGGFRPNRSFTFGSADTLEIQILSWEDTGGTNSTAAANVSVMDAAFPMPQFGSRTRRIRLYLPPGYEASGEHYPVLYMHDGQNLFDLATSFAGEWEVDEALNSLHQQGKKVPIVVGIDNGGAQRIAEYTPWRHAQYGGGDGDRYAQFIVETLKPYIDEHYRTLPDRGNTAVMGSSLGGLISFYIAHKHQDVFGMAGVFSPSFWFSDSVYTFARETAKQANVRYYMMGGTNESASLVPSMQAMIDTLLAVGVKTSDLHMKTVPGGQHNEYLWRTQFREAFEWLFQTQAVSVPDDSRGETMPLLRQHGHQLRIEPAANHSIPSGMHLKLYNMNGQTVYHAELGFDTWLELPSNLRGVFVARIMGAIGVYSHKIFL